MTAHIRHDADGAQWTPLGRPGDGQHGDLSTDGRRRQAVYVLLDDTAASWRALDWAMAEAARDGRSVSALVVPRRHWWEGVGAPEMVAGGPMTLHETMEDLRL